MDELGKRTSGQAYCSSGQRLQACEEGLECTDDPNNTNNGYCRKGGKHLRIVNKCKYTLQFFLICLNKYAVCNNEY